MNSGYMVVAGIGFLSMFAMSFWPRHCLDKFRHIVQEQGGDPDLRIPFSKMKQLDPQLFRQYMLGVLLWIPCAGTFVAGMLAIVLLRK